ncbi:hypothetical protein BDW22DRAFT_978712 [Trametopsis cervina]|nr:hypothetical protein BDW22DRAFT_978712 [Trametopsis cervina]
MYGRFVEGHHGSRLEHLLQQPLPQHICAAIARNVEKGITGKTGAAIGAHFEILRRKHQSLARCEWNVRHVSESRCSASLHSKPLLPLSSANFKQAYDCARHSPQPSPIVAHLSNSSRGPVTSFRHTPLSAMASNPPAMYRQPRRAPDLSKAAVISSARAFCRVLLMRANIKLLCRCVDADTWNYKTYRFRQLHRTEQRPLPRHKVWCLARSLTALVR